MKYSAMLLFLCANVLKFFSVFSMEQGQLKEQLFKAATHNDIATIKALMREKVDINVRNKYGKTALSLAATLGATEAVVELLKYRPDVNLPNNHGWTPLKKAASGSHVSQERCLEVARLLIKAGAAVDQEDDEGYTPLMNAYQSPAMTQVLIAGGANVNHQAFKDGTTALMWMVYENKIETATLLITAGAHDNLRNHTGRNARDIARSYGLDRSNILQLLEQRFGKEQK